MARAVGPDQPYCWVIAIAACVINTMLSGISRATGIFYVALIELYNVPRFEANMPFALRNGFRSLAGPLVGLVGQRYGVRAITVIGCIFATLGIILCSFAPSVAYVSAFWGCFHGLGVAMANTLFQATINQYFVKYRATAAGLALSGACIGSFLFPIALEIFYKTFGLPGAFLLTGGLVMHTLPAAMLLTEPSWLKKPKAIAVENSTGKPHLGEIQEEASPETQKKLSDSSNNRNSIDVKVINSKSSKGEITTVSNGVENPNFVGSEEQLNEKPHRQNPFATTSPKRCRTISAGEANVTIITKHKSEAVPRSSLEAFVKVLKNPMFYMISLSLATFSVHYDPYVTIIVDYAKDKGLDENVGKYMISVNALGDLVGRLCFGWVTDKEYVTLPKFMMMSHVVQGICVVLLPVFYSFEILMGVTLIYGIAAGTIIVMFPTLVGRYLPHEQSLAVGCISFFAGITSFLVPPLIGHFRDHIGSYDGMFYILGCVSVCMGCVWLIEPWLLRLSKSECSSTSHENS